MDAVTLDGLLAELRPRLLGRYLSRPLLASPATLSFEVSGEKARLWLDASRIAAGLYLMPKEAARRLEALAEGQPSGRSRQTLLLVRKHFEGSQVRGLRRLAGHRLVILELSDGHIVLAFGSPPTLGVRMDDQESHQTSGPGYADPRGTGSRPATALPSGPGDPARHAVRTVLAIGDGAPPDLLPAEEPEREWDKVEAEAVAGALRGARAAGSGPTRAVLQACPGLSPRLVRELDESPASYERLRMALRTPRPTVVAPGPPGDWHDADLVGGEAVALLPAALPHLGSAPVLQPSSWIVGAGLFLEARLRGEHFRALRERALQEARRALRRLEKLEAHLVRDLGGLPDEADLRRDAEALLASPTPPSPGADEVEVTDPYDAARVRRVKVDPALGGPQNADRLFTKARRIERARRQVDVRLGETRSALAAARAREERVLEARDAAALPRRQDEDVTSSRVPKGEAGGPRHYLTARGLSLFVGRGARENHHLTFTVARPDDLWLHARDVPGAHVILKDNEGRAGAEDLREAAEVAAYFSDARAESQADVHVTRRKHVRPARGGPGRVALGHTETLRVVPRDPEGRLRRR